MGTYSLVIELVSSLVVKVPVCTSNYLYVVQVIQIKIATHDPMRHYSLLKQHKLTQNR